MGQSTPPLPADRRMAQVLIELRIDFRLAKNFKNFFDFYDKLAALRRSKKGISVESETHDQRLAYGMKRTCWLLDISRPTLNRLIAEGRLATICIERKLLVPAWAVERFVSGKEGHGGN